MVCAGIFVGRTYMWRKMLHEDIYCIDYNGLLHKTDMLNREIEYFDWWHSSGSLDIPDELIHWIDNNIEELNFYNAEYGGKNSRFGLVGVVD